MLAIAILAVICGTIYQFTGTVIRSSNVSLRLDAQEQSFAGLRRLLDAQFAALPTNEIGTFIGVSEEGKHGHLDALQIVCPSGNALLTPDAQGLYRVTLGLDEIPRDSGHYTLVMEREPWIDPDSIGVHSGPIQTVTTNVIGIPVFSKPHPSDSVRLLSGVSSFELAFFDPRLNSWQDKWNDDTLIPSLVRVRLTMENSSAPYEFVEQIPSGGIRRGLPTTTATNARVPNYPVAGQTGTVPGTNGTVPNLPAGLTVPPPPPGYPNTPLQLPTGGNPVPR